MNFYGISNYDWGSGKTVWEYDCPRCKQPVREGPSEQVMSDPLCALCRVVTKQGKWQKRGLEWSVVPRGKVGSAV